jgi:hypothetical protein
LGGKNSKENVILFSLWASASFALICILISIGKSLKKLKKAQPPSGKNCSPSLTMTKGWSWGIDRRSFKLLHSWPAPLIVRKQGS